MKISIPKGLRTSKILFAQVRIRFRGFFLKALRPTEFLMLNSSLFHSNIAEGKISF